MQPGEREGNDASAGKDNNEGHAADAVVELPQDANVEMVEMPTTKQQGDAVQQTVTKSGQIADGDKQDEQGMDKNQTHHVDQEAPETSKEKEVKESRADEEPEKIPGDELGKEAPHTSPDVQV